MILYIDDDFLSRLAAEDAEIVCAADYTEALLQLQTSQPEFVISDFKFPGLLLPNGRHTIGGVEICRYIHQHHPSLPLAFFSGTETSAIQAGLAMYNLTIDAALIFQKPERLPNIINKVRSMMTPDKASQRLIQILHTSEPA